MGEIKFRCLTFTTEIYLHRDSRASSKIMTVNCAQLVTRGHLDLHRKLKSRIKLYHELVFDGHPKWVECQERDRTKPRHILAQMMSRLVLYVMEEQRNDNDV